MFFGENIKQALARELGPYRAQYIQRFDPRYLVKKGSRWINKTPCPHCSQFLDGHDCSACPLEQKFGVGEGLAGTPGCKRAMHACWGPLSFLDSQEGIVVDSPGNPQLLAMRDWFYKDVR